METGLNGNEVKSYNASGNAINITHRKEIKNYFRENKQEFKKQKRKRIVIQNVELRVR